MVKLLIWAGLVASCLQLTMAVSTKEQMLIDKLWDSLSDQEKLRRIDDLQKRLILDINNKGSGYRGQDSQYDVPTYDSSDTDRLFNGGGGGGGYGGGGGGGGNGFGGLTDLLGSGGGGGGGRPSYNAPAPSYNAPAPSYNAPAPKPSYSAQTPKPSYGGGGKGGGGVKKLEIPIPDIPLPDLGQFKAGVIRSKGRIASGLLHTKAGLLRAGANILAQKANALDRFAQAIPGLSAGLIKMTGGGGGGGYGAPKPSYGAPSPPPAAPSYSPPSSGYGVPQGPVLGGNSGGNTNTGFSSSSSSSSFNRPSASSILTNGNSNLGSSSNFGSSASNSYSGATNNFNGNSFSGSSGSSFPVSTGNNFSPSNPDSYGSPQAGVITNNNNNNQGGGFTNVAVGTSLSFGNNNQQASYNNNNNFNNNQGGGNNGNSFGLDPRLKPNMDVEAMLEQSSGGLVNTNSVRSVRPGDVNTITLNDVGRGSEKLLLQESRKVGGSCAADSISLRSLLQDIFMGNEVIPDVIDVAPRYPLDLTYKTIRTFPGMRLTADLTRFKPMMKWPAQPDSLYTVIVSNLDINSRRNRTLSEFWHWFVANIPGDSLDDGEVVYDLLFPLVLPEGDGDHRFGYFVFEQPGEIDYSEEGGPTDSCSPNMSNGRGPFKSTKNFMKKYNLDLTAATFIILDSDESSMEIACEWQKCIGNTINLVSPLQCGKK